MLISFPPKYSACGIMIKEESPDSQNKADFTSVINFTLATLAFSWRRRYANSFLLGVIKTLRLRPHAKGKITNANPSGGRLKIQQRKGYQPLDSIDGQITVY
jgi:hypothetical protein